jgi:methyl-accepting chemotaxis protein
VQKTSFAIMPAVLWTNAITLVLITLATIAVVLFISHRIAGPLFRFEKELKEIAGGDLTKTIRLRRKDQVTDMARELNNMTGGLRDKVLGVEAEVSRLIQLAEEGGTETDWKRELEAVKTRIDEAFKL